MSTISLCMIVKNEEAVIEQCLKSAKPIADEIIIVDTGSTDKTKEICEKFTDKIYDFKWCDDFSLARNFSFSKATKEYIMWLDADDIIPKKSISKLKKLKTNLTSDTYMLKYDIAFKNDKPTFTFFRERILKNTTLAHWQGAVHECIVPFGKIQYLNIAVEHHKTNHSVSDRNLKIYEKIISQRPLSPREQYYYGRELFDHKDYKKCIDTLKNFTKNNLGWKENLIDSCLILSQCYRYQNDSNKEMDYLLKTFSYDAPRANICCKIGDWFIYKKQYNLAIYWYLLATKCRKLSTTGGFVENIYFNYYPYLQLCVAYYNLGDIKKSIKYNLKADKCLSTEITQNNIKFFNTLNDKNN